MTDPTPLSDAAEAVLDALYMDELNGPQQLMARAHAAAALRAAVDQAVPHEPVEAFTFTNEAIRLNRMGIRAAILAIAAELENYD